MREPRINGEHVRFTREQAGRIVLDKELSASTQAKVNTCTERHISRERLEKYLSNKLTTHDDAILVPLPGEVVIETGRQVLNQVTGNPHTGSGEL